MTKGVIILFLNLRFFQVSQLFVTPTSQQDLEVGRIEDYWWKESKIMFSGGGRVVPRKN